MIGHNQPPAAIAATFADFKLVKTRKLAQLVFEIPIEQADEALKALGGLPRSDDERWVGVALMDMKREQPAKERKQFDDLPASQQAALWCREPAFQDWLSRHWDARQIGYDTIDEPGKAAAALRVLCDVTSRSELDTDPKARARWEALKTEYRMATGRMASPR